MFARIAPGGTTFSGVTTALADHWYEPRQRLAIAHNRTAGVDVVFVRGDLSGDQTDLWTTHIEADGTVGATLPLAVNSLSHDFSPQLVRGEDGTMRLFWISDRRGLGWELWTSRRTLDALAWQPARRVPLESFAKPQADARSDRADQLLHYGVNQDRRGRWLVVYRAQSGRVVVLSSDDAAEWHERGVIDAGNGALNPAITQDRSGRYRVVFSDESATLPVWSSNDLSTWTVRRLDGWRRTRSPGSAAKAPHRMGVFGQDDGKLVVLHSDASYGLQYARFHPDKEHLVQDLVRHVGLEAAAATRFGDEYLIAAAGPHGIDVRRYPRFQEHSYNKNSRQKILYHEYNRYDATDRWRRITARMRAIQPDVTSVGVHPTGRVWWGIETGAMTLDGDDFYAVDVSEGFFHHHVTTITPCGELTGLTSRDHDEAVVGVALRRGNGFQFYRRKLHGNEGRVSALHCSDQRLLAATTNGAVFEVNSTGATLVHQFDEGVSALASNSKGHVMVGTEAGSLYRLDLPSVALAQADDATRAITAAVYDSTDRLWVARSGAGVFLRENNAWRKPAGTADHGYADISILRADPAAGVWMMPASNEASRGVAYSNGQSIQLFNPPDRILHAPTGLGVDEEGVVWVGTAFDGLFELTRGANP